MNAEFEGEQISRTREAHTDPYARFRDRMLRLKAAMDHAGYNATPIQFEVESGRGRQLMRIEGLPSNDFAKYLKPKLGGSREFIINNSNTLSVVVDPDLKLSVRAQDKRTASPLDMSRLTVDPSIVGAAVVYIEDEVQKCRQQMEGRLEALNLPDLKAIETE